MPRKIHWVVCLVSAWIACVSSEILLSTLVQKNAWGALIALAEMLVLAILMPRAQPAAQMPRIPPVEMAVRMGAALLIAGIVMLGAEVFGPRVSGILLAFPITASVLPVFTLVLYGADATVRLLSGFITGLTGFVAYFFAFASLVESQGPTPAFVGGVMASLLAVTLTIGWQRLRATMRQ